MLIYLKSLQDWFKGFPLPQKDYSLLDISSMDRKFQREAPEKFYTDKWSNENNAKSEVRLSDKDTGFDCRVDCVTDTHSIEVEFAPKFYESVGQSLVYSALTGKKPGIVLILTTPADIKYYKMLRKMIEVKSLDIDVFPYGPLIEVVKNI